VRRTAILALLPLACAPQAEDSSVCANVEVLVAASDYSSSVVCGAPGCVVGPSTSGVDLGRDPQLTRSNGRVFFLARDNDEIFELDARCGTPLAKTSVASAKGTASVGNPHDVAAAPDGSLFVPLYNAPRIAIVERGTVTGTIDISAYDPDGNPQADAIRIVDVAGVSKAFVTLERLDDGALLRSTRPSQMLRIDVATRTVEAAIDLAGRNPFNPMSERAGALFFAEPGSFDAADEGYAGIEKFDTATSTTKLLVTETALGGSVSEVAVGDRCGAAIVAGPAPNVNPTSLVTFDPDTGNVIGIALGPTPGYDLQGLAWRGRTLYVGDRRKTGVFYTVHVFDRDDGCALTPVPRNLELPQRPVALRAAAVP
jgi:hypothetical protein